MSHQPAVPTRTRSDTNLNKYAQTAQASSTTVIGHYSTSFGLAARLLTAQVRTPVRTIYALVRIADEIVDGAAAEAGVSVAEQRQLLDELELETERAIVRGYSTNLVVHAFAETARQCGIDSTLIAPFFASMRRDLDPTPFSAEGVAEYIYGSAEVIGLMCLRCFVHWSARKATELAVLEDGARHLGAAFQKINFLRDLSCDRETLGRNYFPGIDPLNLNDEQKTVILDDIDADLAIASAVLPLLPPGCRRAVAAAQGLFTRLSRRLRSTPADQLLRSRVRVPDGEKLMIALTSSIGPGAWKR
ncbi:phytoene/squalene synthase family protein [Cryobacterium lyxosi]|uniref:Phytoene/squalene synthase family protein n=1 Tax=Cryobacterium lyxosi TaxID=1259228 RepID=A0A4V3INN2_9MICO|nr:squalene/phytoene synthase family protein [Cryobacterium lyxosi]TFD23848.1 phytoene/squalene synthase family protein [Cryobacterium lyxosi]